MTLPDTTTSGTSLQPISASLDLPGYEMVKGVYKTKKSPKVKGLFPKNSPKTKVKGDYDPNFPLPQLAAFVPKKKKKSP